MSAVRSPVCFMALASTVLLAVAAAPASAQNDSNSRTLAVQLFDQGEALFADGRIAEACPKYAESFRLDPQLGVLIYLGECYEKNNQLASAWGAFREAEEMAAKRGDERQAHAHERALALSPKLDRLTVVVPAVSRLPGLEVLRDGLPVASTLWGNAAVIDSGSHQLEARAPGYKPWRSPVTISGDASSSSITVPKLEVDPLASSPPGVRVESSINSQRIAAIALGGVGIVGLGVGGFFGLSAQSSFSDSKSLCNDDGYCTARGSSLRDSAKGKALVATIAAGAGAASLAAAVVLWFTAPHAERPNRDQTARAARWSVTPQADRWGVDIQGAF